MQRFCITKVASLLVQRLALGIHWRRLGCLRRKWPIPRLTARLIRTIRLVESIPSVTRRREIVHTALKATLRPVIVRRRRGKLLVVVVVLPVLLALCNCVLHQLIGHSFFDTLLLTLSSINCTNKAHWVNGRCLFALVVRDIKEGRSCHTSHVLLLPSGQVG